MKAVICVLLLCAGCGNYHESLKAAEVINTKSFKTLDYAAASALVFQPACASCHGSSHAGGVNLETYASVLPLVAEIRAAVSSDAMPLGGPALNSSQKSLLFAWIDAGAPETSTLPINL